MGKALRESDIGVQGMADYLGVTQHAGCLIIHALRQTLCNAARMTDLVTTAEAARMADVVPSTVTREVARGALTPSLTHPGTGAMMFERADVEEWVRSRTAQASA